MLDACVIKRLTGETVNTATGAVTPAYVQVYSGKCRVQQALAQGRIEVAGQASVVMAERQLQLPVATSPDVRADDIATITACVNDADMIGREFRVRDEHGKSEATARRLLIRERTG
jgi:hypothetical protein